MRDAATWEPVLTRRNPPALRWCAVFTKDSNSVVVGKNDGVAVLEIPSGQELKTFGPLSSYPVAVAVSADGRWIAAAPIVDNPSGGTVHIWDAASGAEMQVIPQTAGESVMTLSFSPDGRRLASAGFDAKIKIWDTESGLELLTLSGHTSWIWKMHFSPDGRRILSCGRDRTLRIWDASPLGSRCGPLRRRETGSVCRKKRGAPARGTLRTFAGFDPDKTECDPLGLITKRPIPRESGCRCCKSRERGDRRLSVLNGLASLLRFFLDRRVGETRSSR